MSNSTSAAFAMTQQSIAASLLLLWLVIFNRRVREVFAKDAEKPMYLLN